MLADIRIIKLVSVLSETVDGWQKELNIVSIDGGPFQYDIREWRLDHFDYRDGISLDEKEATELMINLRKAFGLKDSDLDIEQVKMPVAEFVEKTGGIQEEQKPDATELLQKEGIEFIDKRSAGGALWVVGGHELDQIMHALKAQGFRFFYSETGGRVTKNQPSWYMRAKKK